MIEYVNVRFSLSSLLALVSKAEGDEPMSASRALTIYSNWAAALGWRLKGYSVVRLASTYRPVVDPCASHVGVMPEEHISIIWEGEDTSGTPHLHDFSRERVL